MSYIRKILIALFLFVILGCNENTRPICIIGKIGVAKTHKDSIFHVFVSCLLINPSEKRYYLENEKVNDYKNQWHHYQKGSGKSNKTDNIKIFNQIMSHPTWNKTTDTYKKLMLEYKNKLLRE